MSVPNGSAQAAGSTMMDLALTFSNIINGEARGGEKTTRAINPSNKQLLWEIPVASENDVNDAVNAAAAAFPAWSQTPWEERAKHLERAREVLLGMHDTLASLIMQENGKPIQFAKMEVDHSAGSLAYNASHPPLQPRVAQDDDELRITVRYVPMGVVAAICPFNYPLVQAVAKIGPALVTGNTIIVKPSPFTPYSTMKFIEAVKDIFPPGVLQVLNGDAQTGALLCEHPNVQHISFTGSIAVGKKIMATASKTLKRVTLELGGNDACVIFPDIDISVVTPQVAVGAFLNSGQFCMACKRIYVHEDIYEEFKQKLVDVVKSWKTSPSTPDAGNTLGPLQNDVQFEKGKSYIEDSRKNGYRFALGGEDTYYDDKSYVLQPAIIDNPPDDSRIVKEEPFAPIVPLLKWSNEDDLIVRVNDTNTGLGASVWSGDVDRAVAFGQRIHAGNVTINHFPAPHPNAHLAGWKESGLSGEYGTEGLQAYCNVQTMQCFKAPVGAGSAEAE
ncbi:hypothetical protein VTN49DRAFT_7271 [Thermomyces lanuginosus]|uniref:uncharacterized protein n=1 Tax=Thermomyces lanuginosus TaxID=5541 RepID=UPI00374256CD